MLTYIISSAKFALIFILLNHTAVTIVRASPAGGSVAGLADDIAAELVGQDIQCHENYGTRMDTIASDCVTALTFLSNYAEQYDTTRFEFGDEGIPRSQPMLPSWSTPVTQPFWQGECKIEVRMLPGAAHQPTDVATFKDLAANATKIMICLMYGSGGRSIAGEHKDMGVYVYGPNSKFDKYLKAASTRIQSSDPTKKLDLGGGDYIVVSETDPGTLICHSGASASQVGKQRSGLLFGLDVVETLLMGFCEVGS